MMVAETRKACDDRHRDIRRFSDHLDNLGRRLLNDHYRLFVIHKFFAVLLRR
jgi:hypothetical protein